MNSPPHHSGRRSTTSSKKSKNSSKKPDHRFYVGLKIISDAIYVSTIIEEHVAIGAWAAACSRISSEQVWNRKVQLHCDFEALSVLDIKKTVEQLLIEEGLVKRFIVRNLEVETLCENVACMDLHTLWRLATSDYRNPLVYKFTDGVQKQVAACRSKRSVRRSLTMQEMMEVADGFDDQATTLLQGKIGQLVSTHHHSTLAELIDLERDETMWQIANTLSQPENLYKVKLNVPAVQELIQAIKVFRTNQADMSSQIKSLSDGDIHSHFGDHAEFLAWHVDFAKKVVKLGKAFDNDTEEYKYFYGTQTMDPEETEELKLPKLCSLSAARIGSYMSILSKLAVWTDYQIEELTVTFPERRPSTTVPVTKLKDGDNVHDIFGVLIEFDLPRGPEVREPIQESATDSKQLQACDIITHINGVPVPKTAEEFMSKIIKGEKTVIRVLRNPTEILMHAMQQHLAQLLMQNVALKKSLGMTRMYEQLNHFRTSLKRKLIKQAQAESGTMCTFGDKTVEVCRVLLFSDMFCVTVRSTEDSFDVLDLIREDYDRAGIDANASAPALPVSAALRGISFSNEATPALKSHSSFASSFASPSSSHSSFASPSSSHSKNSPFASRFSSTGSRSVSRSFSRSRSRLSCDFRIAEAQHANSKDHLIAVMLLPIHTVTEHAHPDSTTRLLVKFVNKSSSPPTRRPTRRASKGAISLDPSIPIVTSAPNLTLDLPKDCKLVEWIRKQRKLLRNQPTLLELHQKWEEKCNSTERSRREAWFDAINSLYPTGKFFFEQNPPRRNLPNKNHFNFVRNLFSQTKYSSDDQANIKKLQGRLSAAAGDSTLEESLTAQLTTAKLLPAQRRRMRLVTFRCELESDQMRQNRKILNTLCYRHPVITSQRPALKKHGANEDFFVMTKVEPVLGYQPVSFEEMKSSLCERFAIVGPVNFHKESRMSKFTNISVVHVWGTNFEDNKTKDYHTIFEKAAGDEVIFSQLYVDEIVKTFTLAFEAAKIMGAKTLRVPAIGLGQNTLQALPQKERSVICDKFFAALIAVSSRYSSVKLDKRFPYVKGRPETNLFQEVSEDDVCIISPCEAWSFLGNGGSSFWTVDSRIATGSYSRELREACGNCSAYLHNVFFSPELMQPKASWSYVNALVYDVASNKGSTSQWAVVCKFKQKELRHELCKLPNDAQASYMMMRKKNLYKYSALYEVQLNGMNVLKQHHGCSGLGQKSRLERMSIYCNETVAGAVIADSLRSQNIRDKGKPLMWGTIVESPSSTVPQLKPAPSVDVSEIQGLLVVDLMQLAIAPPMLQSLCKLNHREDIQTLDTDTLDQCFGEDHTEVTMKPLKKVVQKLWNKAKVATVFSVSNPTTSRTMLQLLLARLGLVISKPQENGAASPPASSSESDAVYAICCSSSVLVDSLGVMGVTSFTGKLASFQLLAVQSYEERANPTTMAKLATIGVGPKHIWRQPPGMNKELLARIISHFGLASEGMEDSTRSSLPDLGQL